MTALLPRFLSPLLLIILLCLAHARPSPPPQHLAGSFQACNLKVTSLQLSKTSRVWSPLCCRWLDNNYLKGQLPLELGQLKNLTSLPLSNNFLSGNIPLCIFKLPKLREVILINNQWSGPLPDKNTFSVIDIFVAGNPELCTIAGSLNFSECVLTSTFTSARVKNRKSLLSAHRSNLSSPAPEVPAYILGPEPPSSSPGSGTHTGAIAGGVAGAVGLVLVTLALVCLSLLRAKRLSSGQSDTGSSDPSTQVEWIHRPRSPLVGQAVPAVSEVQTGRQFSLAELEKATKQWNPINLIGEGGFGLVYKGLLEDGTIVAIKKRAGSASEEFSREVGYLSHLRHKHLVTLLGYCQENDQQMIVYDYLPNGSVSSHLYDANGCCLGKLDFKQRLSIALGAAKGLEYLHSLVPPLVHRGFKTTNVLVDENFVSKVTDYGLSRLLVGGQDVVLSRNGAGTAGFLDPEFFELQILTEKSDVYSFGMFLLELISGRQAISGSRPQPEPSLVEWARSLWKGHNLEALVDNTLGGNFTEDGIKLIMEMCFLCTEPAGDKRPSMREVAKELDEIFEKESGLTADVEGGASVALGSELFLRRA